MVRKVKVNIVPKVIVYSRPYCSTCKVVKHILTTEGIEFEELDAQLYMERLGWFGIQGVPAIGYDGTIVYGSIAAVKSIIKTIKSTEGS